MNPSYPTRRAFAPVRSRLLTGLLLALSALSAAAADYSSTILSQAPVGYWRLNETVQPQPVFDVATNLGTLGAAENGQYFEDAIRGEPGAFGGSPSTSVRFNNPGFQVGYLGSSVDIPNDPGLNPTTAFTVEFWARPSDIPPDLFCPVASLDASAGRSGFLFYAGTSGGVANWQFRVGAATGYTGTATGGDVVSNAWHYITGVYDGSSITLYVNGASAATAPVANFAPNTAEPLRIGATTIPNRGWDGWVQDVAVYPVAFTAAQVASHYNTGKTNGAAYQALVLSASPAGYWRLNEPADPAIPVAANSGTLGASGNGGYIYASTAGVAGPSGTSFPGFESGNKAVGLNGTSGYVSLPALNLNTNTVSISAWVNPSGTEPTDVGIVFTRTGNTTAGLKTDVSDPNGLGYNWNDASSSANFKSSLVMPAGSWSFVGLSVHPDFAVLALYDGTAFNYVTNFDSTADAQPFEGEWRIGNDSGNSTNIFNGSIDEVAIFNRSLSLGELFTEYAAAVGGVKPQIFVDPQSPPTDVAVGEPLVLSVDAGGTPALLYQWRHGTTAISGATNAVFIKDHAALSDAGDYSVVVSSTLGSVTSQSATVSVIQLSQPVITQEPAGRTLFPSASYTFTVTATGGALSYQWSKDSKAIPGATGSSYSLSNITATNAGVYTVVVSNSVGSAPSDPATLVVTVPASGSYESLIVADGPESWWRLNESPGSTSLFDSMGRHDGTYVGSGVLPGQPGVIHTGTGASASFDGSASYGSIPYSSVFNPTTNFSVEVWVKADPAGSGVELTPISSYSLTGAAGRGYGWLKTTGDEWWGITGNNDQYNYYYLNLGTVRFAGWEQLVVTVDSTGFTYYLNGALVGGPYGDYVRNTSSPFLIGARDNDGAIHQFFQGQIAEVSFYKKPLTADQISAHYKAALYGNDTAPVFLEQPSASTQPVGSDVVFTATAEGTDPVTLQWKKDGKDIPGATNSTVTITNIDFSDGGNYVLVASNPVGSTPSNPALLTVVPLPAIALVTNDLVLHLKFDGAYSDSSGRSNDATPKGSPGFVAGKIGTQALHYNTDTANSIFNYVDLGAPDDLQFGTDINFSVSYWVRLPKGYEGGDLPFISNARNSYSNPGYTFAPSYQKGGWSWSLAGAGTYGPDNTINDGKWHHLLHTFDRTGHGITYLDGDKVDERPATGSGDLSTGDPTSIGQDPTGAYPETGSADLDDVGIWRRVLTPYEAWKIFYVGDKFGMSFDAATGPVTIQARQQADGEVELIWGGGKLQSADNLNGPWTDVSGNPSVPFLVTPNAPTKFYRGTF